VRRPGRRGHRPPDRLLTWAFPRGSRQVTARRWGHRPPRRAPATVRSRGRTGVSRNGVRGRRRP
jgi:hypothetical protein